MATTFYRNWDDGLLSDQTSMSSASGTVTSVTNASVSPTPFLALTPSSTSTDVKTFLDFANTCTDFDATFKIYFPSGCGSSQQAGFIYRTTSRSAANDTYGYVVSITTSGIGFGRGSNSTSGSWTSINSMSFGTYLAYDTWHTVRIVVTGTSHTIYINGVQNASWVDSTYTSAGSVGFRVFAGSSTSYLGYDSFSIITDYVYPAPTISLPSGYYTATHSVSITSSNSGTIYYTTDGTTPTTASSIYSSALNISSSCTIQAIQSVTSAYVTGSSTSQVVSASYTYIASITAPVIALASGTARGLAATTITIPSDGIVYYTVDGSTPSTSNGSIYQTGQVVSIPVTGTLKAATYLDGSYSSIASAHYTILPIESVIKLDSLKLSLSLYLLDQKETDGAITGTLPLQPTVYLAGSSAAISDAVTVSDGSLLQTVPSRALPKDIRNNSLVLTYQIPTYNTEGPVRLGSYTYTNTDTSGSLVESPLIRNEGILSFRPQASNYSVEYAVTQTGHLIVGDKLGINFGNAEGNEALYTVSGGSNTSPVASQLIPASGTILVVGSPTTVSALLTDADGDLIAWSLSANGSPLASGSSASGTIVSTQYTPNSASTVTFSLTLTDIYGASSTSTWSASAVIDHAPTGSFISPVDTRIRQNNAPKIRVDMADIDSGDIIAWKIFDNGTILAQGTTSSEIQVAVAWTPTLGDHELIMTLTDTVNVTTTITGPLVDIVKRANINIA